jgi:FixJ family two-component response regulator
VIRSIVVCPDAAEPREDVPVSTAPLIAIVDDDIAVREALADLLEAFDLERQAFDGSESFLAAHTPGLFSCLITDINLPGLSGLQLLERMGALEPELPVIVISAQTDPCPREKAMRSGALAFFTKPVNDRELHRTLMSALGRGPAPT